MKIRYPSWARVRNGSIDTGNVFGPSWIALPCRVMPEHVELVRGIVRCYVCHRPIDPRHGRHFDGGRDRQRHQGCARPPNGGPL